MSSRAYFREYNRLHRAERNEGHKRWRRAIAAKIDEAKNKPCADCGGRFPPCVMEFHHVRGIKKFGISESGRGQAKAWWLVEREIAKCVILCSNCHKIREAS